MAQISSIKRVEIFPSNRGASNTWSYKNGNPQLVFSGLGIQDMYLLSNTLRLNFNLTLKDRNGNSPNNDNATGAGAVDIRLNEMVSSMACIQNITISNSQNQTLEFVRNFPRLLASLIPMGANFHDYATYLQQYFGATSNKAAQGRKVNNVFEVSAPLLCGMFLNGEAIPIGMNGTGGLQIKLNLAPSIESNYGTNGAGSYYELSNVSLTCALGVPPSGKLPAISSLPYNSFSSFYSTLQNGDVTENIQCGLSSVVSSFSNFVPTKWIANDVEDGNRTTELLNDNGAGVYNAVAPITRYTVLRGGIRYPYNFTVDETQNVSSTGQALPAQQFVQDYTAQRQRNFLSSMKLLSDTKATLSGPLSEATAASDASTQFNTAGAHVTGVGQRMDQLGIGAGANYKTRNFSHRIQSKLDGRSSNSIYTFMLHRNMISFNDRGAISVAN